MFREKPSAYDRIVEAIGDIGERIADLEEQVAERLDSTPSRSERIRRAVSRRLASLSDDAHDDVPRGLPGLMGGLWLPTRKDVEARAHEARRSLPGWRESVGRLRSSLHDLRPHEVTVFRQGMRAQRGIDFLRERPVLSGVLIAGGAIAAAGGALYVTKKISDHTEEPDYDVVRQDGDIEIRDYEAMIVAETVKAGYHEKARKAGFEALSDYVLAHDRSGRKIAMTAPVLQQLSEGSEQTRGWAVRLPMPKRYNKASLPAPASRNVEIKEVPATRMAAIRFSGSFSASLASRKLMALYDYLAEEGLTQKGDPQYAFYNPPWTPGFLRRNEILIAIER